MFFFLRQLSNASKVSENALQIYEILFQILLKDHIIYGVEQALLCKSLVSFSSVKYFWQFSTTYELALQPNYRPTKSQASPSSKCHVTPTIYTTCLRLSFTKTFCPCSSVFLLWWFFASWGFFIWAYNCQFSIFHIVQIELNFHKLNFKGLMKWRNVLTHV